jgi:hypothetical protein
MFLFYNGAVDLKCFRHASLSGLLSESCEEYLRNLTLTLVAFVSSTWTLAIASPVSLCLALNTLPCYARAVLLCYRVTTLNYMIFIVQYLSYELQVS